jgi:hypothetical protein
VGFKPAERAVTWRMLIIEPQQLPNDRPRSARDEYRTVTPKGSCVAFATPPPAADKPLQTRHTPSCPGPRPGSPSGQAQSASNLDSTPIRPPRNKRISETTISARGRLVSAPVPPGPRPLLPPRRGHR